MAVREYLDFGGGGFGELFDGELFDGELFDGGDVSLTELLVTPYGYGFVVVLSAALLLLVRVGLNGVYRPMHPVTAWAWTGGLLGGAIVSYVIGVGITVTKNELPRLRGLQWAHVMYGTLGGAVFPWAYASWMGARGSEFAAFPATLHTGQAWGMVMFVLAAAVYYLLGALGGLGNNLRQWGAIVGMYLVYGVFLGLWMGFYTPLFS